VTETLERLRRRLKSTTDLQSVVKTMKALAAVNIRQYEQSVDALEQYNEVIERGLQIVLINRIAQLPPSDHLPAPTGLIVFGSDQGLVGQFNQRVASFASQTIGGQGPPPVQYRILAVGARVAASLENAGHSIEETFTVPGSVSTIAPLVQTLVMRIQAWRVDNGVLRVHLFYNHTLSAATYEPMTTQLLPIDPEWVSELQQRPWLTNQIPTTTMDWDALFSALIRQYLLVALFRASAESLAAENASRLAAMQAAERNIEEHLDRLHMRYHQRRQDMITEELMDIIAGFETLGPA
jgi:F-type H+-transporting ATPase subunit gamma